jgi:hypothetical protein
MQWQMPAAGAGSARRRRVPVMEVAEEGIIPARSIVDTTDQSSIVRAKASVRCVGHQARKLRGTHMKKRLVIAMIFELSAVRFGLNYQQFQLYNKPAALS